MRLLLTLDFPPDKGGIQRYLGDIVCNTFTDSDRVFAGVSRKSDEKVCYPCEVRYFYSAAAKLNRKFLLIKMLIPLFKLLGEKDKEITVESGNLSAAVAPFLVSFVRRCNYYIYTYGTELVGLDKVTLRSFFYRAILRKAAKVYVLGAYTRTLLEKTGYSGAVEQVVPRISLPVKIPEKSESEDFRILTVGRLVYHKGQDVLLRALGGIPSLKWNLVIAGSGPQKGRLIRLARELGVSHCVEFREGLSDKDLSKLYEEADLFVLSSRECSKGTEGFGIVLLEAMAYRCPVVATRAGGIPEVLGQGECAMLVEPGDEKQLREAILLLASHRTLRLQFAEKALQRLRKHYVW